MNERSKKPTLEQVRTLYPFDVPTLASKAEVETDTLYYALLQRPIVKKDAAKIITALSQHTGLNLSFEHLDIIMWEEFLMLWLIRASTREQPYINEEAKDQYHFVYAQNRQHAAVLAHEWLQQYPQLPNHSFMACPEGFTIGEISVPGYQQRETD